MVVCLAGNTLQTIFPQTVPTLMGSHGLGLVPCISWILWSGSAAGSPEIALQPRLEIWNPKKTKRNCQNTHPSWPKCLWVPINRDKCSWPFLRLFLICFHGPKHEKCWLIMFIWWADRQPLLLSTFGGQLGSMQWQLSFLAADNCSGLSSWTPQSLLPDRSWDN